MTGLEDMPRGLPRPRNSRGTVVPYIAAGPESLGAVEHCRQEECVKEWRCQVCGDLLGEMTVVAVNDSAPGGELWALDGAGVHPPCWRMAIRLCPELRTLAGRGDLLVWEMPTVNLRLHDDGYGCTPGIATPDRVLAVRP